MEPAARSGAGRAAAAAVLCAAVLAVPALFGAFAQYFALNVLLLMLLALSFNLLFGMTGLLSFGHAAFYAAGAYSTALLLRAGAPLFPAVIAGALPRLCRSRLGRALRATRENAERAEFSGIRVRRTIFLAFVVAGAFAGLAGALLAPLEQTVAPTAAHWTKSAEPVMATLIGGPFSFAGPIVGAVVYLGLKEIIVRFTEYWLLVFGLVLLGVVLAFRGGLLGAAEALLSRRPWMSGSRT